MSRPGPRGPRRDRSTPRGGKRSAPQTQATNDTAAHHATPVESAPQSTSATEPQTPTRTAGDTRQELHTGTVVELLAGHPQRVVSAITLDVPNRTKERFSDRTVEKSTAFIRHSGIDTYITDRRDARKIKSGRPAKINTRAVLVAMHLTVADGQPLLLTVIRQTLLERLSPTMRAVLNIKFPTRPDDTSAHARWEEAADAAVRRAFHRLLDTVNPSITPKNRVRTWDQVEELKKGSPDPSVGGEPGLRCRTPFPG